MLKRERQSHIIQQLNVHNKVLSGHLSEQLQVSEDTVRRDLQELSDQGLLIKVHGGALSNSFHFTLQNAQIYSPTEKRTIAEKAAGLIRNGMVVLLSGGTTIRELVKVLPPDLNATFITVSVPTAMELMNHPGSEVIFIGNKLHKNAQMAVGAGVIQKLQGLKADLCMLGTNCIDVQEGITDLDWEVIEVKRAMIEVSDKLISLAISEKLNSVQRLRVCGLNEVDVLVTELDCNDARLQTYSQKGVKVL